MKNKNVDRFLPNILRSTCLVILLLPICTPAVAQTYDHAQTSGPFYIAPTAASVDWVVLNNDTVAVDILVTVYRLQIGAPKIVLPPGALALTVLPGESTHNANSVGTVFISGFAHEIVVEATSDKVTSHVSQWDCFSATCFIPSTLIPAGDLEPIRKPAKKIK